jgi:isopenicillin-N N-acyltransferase-like protein
MTRQFTSTVAGPEQRGREFGTVHAGEVGATVSAYLRLFADRGAQTEGANVADLVDSWGRRALRRIEDFAPDLAAEIHGIAAGSGQSAARIAALNARTEILAALAARVPDECSTVVTVAAGRPLAMQNWDWFAGMAGNWLQWTIPHPDGRRTTTVTEYGVVGKIGMSDRGVGTMFNILHHADDGGADIGVPVHVIARRILDEAVDVADAVRICATARATGGLSASTSITVVDRTTAVSAELWPGGIGAAYPDRDGLLVRTNHFLTAPAAAGDTGPTSDSDTLQRYASLRKVLDGRAAELDPASLFAALAADSDGVCCHPLPHEDPEFSHATLATVALDPHAASLWVHDGSPCQAEVPLLSH